MTAAARGRIKQLGVINCVRRCQRPTREINTTVTSRAVVSRRNLNMVVGSTARELSEIVHRYARVCLSCMTGRARA